MAVSKIKKISPSHKRFSCCVDNVQKTGTQSIVRLATGSDILLSPFAYIRAGDMLDVDFNDGQLTSVKKMVHSNGDGVLSTVQLFPTYKRTERISVAPHTINVTFRERQSKRDWNTVKQLEQFHYRGNGLNKIVGRRTVLLADAEGIGVIGFGVLSATVVFCKPRFELLDTNVGDLLRSRLINRLARIPRIVVHPEFRGLGIGAALARHLTSFAENHWDINGYKPVLIEVIASMTDYHRFFEFAGFVEAGRTKGTARVFRPKYGNGSFEGRPNAKNYKFFSPLGPKPYLVYPLGSEMRSLLKEKRIISDLPIELCKPRPTLKNPIKATNASIGYRSRNLYTSRAKEIGIVFGLNGSQSRFPVLSEFNCTIQPGDVVLVTGASGSGKSTLMKLLTTPLATLRKALNVKGTRTIPPTRSIAILNETSRSRKPLIDMVGRSLHEGVALLNTAGLAEAHLYLKSANEISEGQRYRFAIAQLCDSRKPVWVADEFASKLDPLTAAIVAKGLRRVAYFEGATVILAAPHVEHFLNSLCPNQVVHLSWGGKASTFAAKMHFRIEKDRVRLWVDNRGPARLTGVQIVATNSLGDSRLLLKAISVESRSSGPIVDLPLSVFLPGDVIRASSNEGVGDVLYVTRRNQ